MLCRKGGPSVLTDSEIYFRYRGRTQKIRFAELQQILQEQRRLEQEVLLRHIKRVTEIGVTNAGILDSISGVVDGVGGSFLIDEKLIPKISFIKEGHFKESSTAPALKLVGEAQAINSTILQPTQKLYRTKAIRTPDIFDTFLNQDEPEEPIEYAKQICFETSAYLPIYYFLKLAKVKSSDAISILNSVTARGTSKNRLIRRLEKTEDLSVTEKATNSTSSKRKKEIYQTLKDKTFAIKEGKSEVI